jgi:hypothetical protein
MKRLSLLVWVGVLSVASLSPADPPGPPGPPNPQFVAQHCIQRMNHITWVANHRMHQIANVGVAIINQLQENGQDEQAAEVAANRIAHINQVAANRSQMIMNVLSHCVERLTELEAPEALIAEVQEVADARLASIEEHRAEEVARIEEALAD